MPKVVLAYTGGLATSLCIHWLRMKKGLEVVTFTANVGQGVNLEPVGERALELGAGAAHIGDLRDRFLRGFAFPTLRAGAVYQSGYFLGTALTRPLIVQEMARIAADDRCDMLAHGCSGSGNDRVRFEAAAAALAPHLKLLAPLEEWGLTSRADQLRYARRYGMRFVAEEGAPEDAWHEAFPSVDQNLWGMARPHDAAQLDPWEPAPERIFRTTTPTAEAPAAPDDLRIGFRRGFPVQLDGKAMKPVALVEALNALGAKHGVGRNDVIEDRIGGVKTREVYEAPAAAILFEAHRALESLVMPKGLVHYKSGLSRRYAELVYDGLWWSDLRDGLDAFFGRVAKKVTGEVRVRLEKGQAVARGVRSPFSLYDRGRALAAIEERAAPEVPGFAESAGYAVRAGGRSRLALFAAPGAKGRAEEAGNEGAGEEDGG
jgi:argininosuccinate synthase